jgi:single-strand DNA-binding protein
MAKGYNKVILMGNLTRDPEMRTIPNGNNVTNFSLAVNRQWNDQSGAKQEAVTYVDCVAWGKPGEIINTYMKKGGAILVTGRLESRSWDQDGQKRSKIEINVEEFNFVGGPAEGQGRGGSDGSSYSQASSSSSKALPDDNIKIDDIDADAPINLDDIPF